MPDITPHPLTIEAEARLARAETDLGRIEDNLAATLSRLANLRCQRDAQRNFVIQCEDELEDLRSLDEREADYDGISSSA